MYFLQFSFKCVSEEDSFSVFTTKFIIYENFVKKNVDVKSFVYIFHLFPYFIFYHSTQLGGNEWWEGRHHPHFDLKLIQKHSIFY